ncbi:MAG: metalloregulator ArsR/SmtB family transcription factor [Acholeplasmataceae bacterium]|jgi:ArsR family transcriptional regulator|nr:metalloregulator ArsR/SmtB family transcription factor [Acholeplasmataceae bacterium]
MNKDYALLFKALSDENRIKILELLIQGETCGCTLIDKLTIKQPTMSYHLKTLTDAGLTTAYREGNWIKHHVDIQKIDDMIEFLIQLKTSEASCKS